MRTIPTCTTGIHIDRSPNVGINRSDRPLQVLQLAGYGEMDAALRNVTLALTAEYEKCGRELRLFK
jgi:hypothetical protein